MSSNFPFKSTVNVEALISLAKRILMIRITKAVLINYTKNIFNNLEDSYFDRDLCPSNSANSNLNFD